MFFENARLFCAHSDAQLLHCFKLTSSAKCCKMNVAKNEVTLNTNNEKVLRTLLIKKMLFLHSVD